MQPEGGGDVGHGGVHRIGLQVVRKLRRQAHVRSALAAAQLHAGDVLPARPEVHALLRQFAGAPVAARQRCSRCQRSAEARQPGSRVLLPALARVGAAAHQELVAVGAAVQLDPHVAAPGAVEHHGFLERQRADFDSAAGMQLRHRGAGDLDVRRARQHRPAGHRVLAQHPQILDGVRGLEHGPAVAVGAHTQQGVAGRRPGRRRAPVGTRSHAFVGPDAPVDGQPVRTRSSQRVEEGIGGHVVHLAGRAQPHAGRGEHRKDVELAGRQQFVQHACAARLGRQHLPHRAGRLGGDGRILQGTGRVEHAVHGTPASPHVGNHFGHGWPVCHVGAVDNHFTAGRFEGEQLAQQAGGLAWLRAGRQRRPGAAGRQLAAAHQRQPGLAAAGEEGRQFERDVAQATGEEIDAAFAQAGRGARVPVGHCGVLVVLRAGGRPSRREAPFR